MEKEKEIISKSQLDCMMSDYLALVVYIQRYIMDLMPDFTDDGLIGIYNYVIYILERIEKCNMSRLAQIISLPLNNTTKIVNKLVDIGLVQREHDIKDRRYIYISLTDYCKNKLNEIHTKGAEGINEEHANLTQNDIKEINQHLNALIKIFSKCDKYGCNPMEK